MVRRIWGSQAGSALVPREWEWRHTPLSPLEWGTGVRAVRKTIKGKANSLKKSNKITFGKSDQKHKNKQYC